MLVPLRGGGVGSILDLDGEEQEERGIIPAERRMAIRLGKDTGMRTGNPVPGPEDQDFISRSALEATQGQMDGFFSQLPYKCHQNRVASVGD